MCDLWVRVQCSSKIVQTVSFIGTWRLVCWNHAEVCCTSSRTWFAPFDRKWHSWWVKVKWINRFVFPWLLWSYKSKISIWIWPQLFKRAVTSFKLLNDCLMTLINGFISSLCLYFQVSINVSKSVTFKKSFQMKLPADGKVKYFSHLLFFGYSFFCQNGLMFLISQTKLCRNYVSSWKRNRNESRSSSGETMNNYGTEVNSRIKINVGQGRYEKKYSTLTFWRGQTHSLTAMSTRRHPFRNIASFAYLLGGKTAEPSWERITRLESVTTYYKVTACSIPFSVRAICVATVTWSRSACPQL